MAIAGLKSTKTHIDPKDSLTISSDHYKGVVYDDQQIPLHHLLGQVAGTPWTVDDYYHQHLGKHNDLREMDVEESAVYQQYTRIKSLELRVVSALSSSTDQNTGITTVTGTALIYPFLIPNVNDYFKARTLDNQKALFRITQVERRAFNRDSVYQVDFQLDRYESQDPEFFSEFDRKVVNTLYFNKDRILENLNPLLTKTQQKEQEEVILGLRDIIPFYFKNFFDIDTHTLVLPGQPYKVYDAFITKFLLSILETENAPEVRLLRTRPVDYRDELGYYQFWDVLIERNPALLSMCNKKMGVLDVKRFNHNPWLSGLRFGLIDKVIFPKEPDSTRQSSTHRPLLSAGDLSLTKTTNVDGLAWEDDSEIQPIPEVLGDEFYVLSEKFYKQEQKLTVLEKMVLDYLHHRTLQVKELKLVLKDLYSWNRLEQFYFIPIIILLMKDIRLGRY